MKKLSLIVEGGAIAQEPESTFRALVAAAVQDGANESEWVDRLLKAAGASAQTVAISERAKFKVIEEAVQEPDRLFQHAMALIHSEITALLQRAAREADTEHLKEQAKR